MQVDGNLQASQSLAFQFDTGATLDLFVAGTFYAAQTLTLGSAARPENCRVFVAGASFVTSGNAAYGCNVYAPNAPITLANNTVVSGSIFAKDIQVSGNATVHYDTSILGAGSECCTVMTAVGASLAWFTPMRQSSTTGTTPAACAIRRLPRLAPRC